MPVRRVVARDILWGVLLLVAAAALLGVGYVYAVSGLLVPSPVVIGLLVAWVLLAWWLVRLAVRRSWLVALPPVVGAAGWFLVVAGGSALFGWTA